MRIQTVDISTKKPLARTTIQLQIRGQNSGVLTVTTDQNGFFVLDDSYMGHQIGSALSNASGGSPNQGPFVTATDGAVWATNAAKQKTTTGAGTGSHK